MTENDLQKAVDSTIQYAAVVLNKKNTTVVVVAVDNDTHEVRCRYWGPHALATMALETAAADFVEDLG